MFLTFSFPALNNDLWEGKVASLQAALLGDQITVILSLECLSV